MRADDLERQFSEWGQVLRVHETAGETPSIEALIGYTRAAQDLKRSADWERVIRLHTSRIELTMSHT
jgi:hypothetical protein